MWLMAIVYLFINGFVQSDDTVERALKSIDKILQDFSIQTDHVIEVRRPDLVVVDKKERSCKITDFPVPGDRTIGEKEKDKIENYQDFRRVLQNLWNVKVKIMP